jgi:hypothetical protein
VAKPSTSPAPTAAAQTAATLLRAPVAGAIASLGKKIHVGQIVADKGTIGKIGAGQVILGDTTIKNVILQNTTATINGGKALLQNVRLILELQFHLDWSVGFSVFGHHVGASGSDNLGSLSFPFTVGDIQVPALQNISLQIPSLTASGIKATLAPIANLALGEADLQNFEADNTDLPADGFALSGLGLGSLQLAGVEIPKTLTEKASLAALALQSNVVLPGAEINNLQLPAAAAGNISSPGLAFDALPSARSIGADFGVLKITLSVQPVAHTMIGALVIQDVKLAAAIGKLSLQEIQVPLKVLGVTLQQITLEKVKVANISL